MVQTSKLRKESMISMASPILHRKGHTRFNNSSERSEIIWIKEEYEEPHYRGERNNMSSEVLSSNVIPFADSGLAAYTAPRDISNKLRMLYQKASQYRLFG